MSSVAAGLEGVNRMSMYPRELIVARLPMEPALNPTTVAWTPVAVNLWMRAALRMPALSAIASAANRRSTGPLPNWPVNE